MDIQDRNLYRRQILALLGSGLFTLLYWLAAGLLGELEAVPWLTAVYWAGVLMMFYWGWSGRSRHWRDPGMTFWHLLWSILFVTMTIMFSPSLRPVMMLGYLSLLPFGVLGLGWRAFIGICFIEICCYSLLVLMPSSALLELDARLEILMAIGFVLTVMGYGLIGREVILLRNAYGRKNRELRSALARIEDLAIRDEQTGLYNRRYFQMMVEHQRAVCSRDSRPFVVAILDIDHFDHVRTHYGERCSERVLAEAGHLVAGMVREIDLVARYGDGEFAVLLAGAPLHAGVQVLERIRQMVADEAFSIEQVRLTMSIGVVQYQPNESGDVLIQRADQLVAEAQRAGRNQVESRGYGV